MTFTHASILSAIVCWISKYGGLRTFHLKFFFSRRFIKMSIWYLKLSHSSNWPNFSLIWAFFPWWRRFSSILRIEPRCCKFILSLSFNSCYLHLLNLSLDFLVSSWIRVFFFDLIIIGVWESDYMDNTITFKK